MNIKKGGFLFEREGNEKTAARVLNTFLRVDANSTSCLVAYQPKAPKELKRFRREK